MNKATILFLFFLVPFLLKAQSADPETQYMKDNYDKFEYRISMRDGAKLFTLVYMPKDKSKTYPILMNRTCYNASAYAGFNTHGHPSSYLVHDGYILVFQDVRGRYMSDGLFNNMTPNIPGNDPMNKKDVDESSDTWDSIDWMVNNLAGNNGRVGIYGISYPGFYSAASLPDAHPALKAVSPQAPISDFFFDDFHHMGAYLQSYTAAFAVFGYQKKDTTRKDWFNTEMMRVYSKPVKDGYDFHLKMGPLKNITEKLHYDNFFWNQMVDHPNYDTFWQKRSILPHLKNTKPAVLTVGGWFDAEDLYGPLNIYKTIEKNTPGAKNSIVMGPWGHGDWARENGKSTHNHIYFGDSISTFFQKEIERNFFNFHLKGEGEMSLPEAYMFNTGKKEWQKFDVWPPADIPPVKLTFGENGKLFINQPANEKLRFEYTSDPAKPVPYTSQTEGLTFTPRNYMSDDQREAGRRPDVLTFETDVLGDEVTLAGEILAKLKVALSTTDADFVVKLIDVYPDNHPNYPHNPKNVVMGGYQQLVRSEVFRGRFRNSFEKPEPFVPGKVTDVNVPLQDVLHTFKKGHRIMIQIHSTWFPFIDRNPQNYVENIYKADEKDFIKSAIKVYGSSVIGAGGEQAPKKSILMTERVEQLRHHYQMQPHPEGGYFLQTYKSSGSIPQSVLPEGFAGSRPFSTAIYFLLEQGNFSAFHRIRSDECWHFYEGQCLLVHILNPEGNLTTIRLGPDISNGELYQYVVPANCWFASEPAPGSIYSFVGCTVSPGFDFDDFELAGASALAAAFPAHAPIIHRLCR